MRFSVLLGVFIREHNEREPKQSVSSLRKAEKASQSVNSSTRTRSARGKKKMWKPRAKGIVERKNASKTALGVGPGLKAKSTFSRSAYEHFYT